MSDEWITGGEVMEEYGLSPEEVADNFFYSDNAPGWYDKDHRPCIRKSYFHPETGEMVFATGPLRGYGIVYKFPGTGASLAAFNRDIEAGRFLLEPFDEDEFLAGISERSFKVLEVYSILGKPPQNHSSRGKPKPEQVTIPAPDGTKWEQIKIRIVNDERIEISHPDGSAPWTKADLGFARKEKLWSLFEIFSKFEGTISKCESTIKANVSNLRKHIRSLFPSIKEGTPIRDWSPRNGYVCNFKISRARQESDMGQETDNT